MKNVLKLEELGMLLFFMNAYFRIYDGSWVLFLSLFFVPDLAFIFYFLNKKMGAIAYNIMHHKGIMAVLFIIGFEIHNILLLQIALVFLAHSSFDRVAGYGLKYLDNFDHTHLGWIGKSKFKNE